MMEKLVISENLRANIILILADVFLAEAHEKDEKLLDEGIGALIALIGKAYADGELEWPGEVGRKREFDYEPNLWASEMIEQGANEFIALRPLSGTGKEEDK